MDAVGENEAGLVIRAMELDEKLGRGERIPFYEMGIVAAFHPEEETRRMVGKAMVVQVLHGAQGGERKLDNLRRIATEGRNHADARADACTILRRVLSEQGKWGELASMALDGRYPKKGREDFASAYFSSPEMGIEKALGMLGCVDLGEEFRQNEGMRLVDRGLQAGEITLARRIAEEGKMPSMLKVYARSALGKGGRFPKERKSVPPEPASVEKALAGARKAT